MLSRVYRARLVAAFLALAAAGLAVAAGVLAGVPAGRLLSALGFVVGVGTAVMLGVSRVVAAGLAVPDPVVVHPPVRGRWLAMNSPATKVPSHGVRAYGQAHAIDLVHEPEDHTRPAFRSRPVLRRPEEYPAFGQPVHAMVDGVVVAVSDSQRDHRARATWVGLGYLLVESIVRELGGPRFIVGNHITIRTPEGRFALVAHLQRGSACVAEGDTVVAGQVIAACGNSGNSSEPHVHAQVMDRRSLWTAHGMPMAFAGVRIGEELAPTDGLPADDEQFTA